MIARRATALPNASREAAIAELEREVAAALGARRWREWPTAERRGFSMLAPVAALVLPQIQRWPRRDRAALAQIIRAKGGPQESTFVTLSQHHHPWLRALSRFARRESR